MIYSPIMSSSIISYESKVGNGWLFSSHVIGNLKLDGSQINV